MVIKLSLAVMAIGVIYMIVINIFKDKRTAVETRELESIIKDKRQSLAEIEDRINKSEKVKSNSITDLINRIP